MDWVTQSSCENIYHDKYARVEQKLTKNGYVLNFQILWYVWHYVFSLESSCGDFLKT